MAWMNQIYFIDSAVIVIHSGSCAYLEVSKLGVVKTTLRILAELHESSGEWAVRLPQTELTGETKEFWHWFFRCRPSGVAFHRNMTMNPPTSSQSILTGNQRMVLIITDTMIKVSTSWWLEKGSKSKRQLEEMLWLSYTEALSIDLWLVSWVYYNSNTTTEWGCINKVVLRIIAANEKNTGKNHFMLCFLTLT